MAGSYPDVPSRRMAWDADGSILIGRDVANGLAAEEGSAAAKADLNDEDHVQAPGPIGGNTTTEVTVIFPELREWDGIYAYMGRPGNDRITVIESSGDTTNGIDGSWTTAIADYDDVAAGGDTVPDTYRTEITSVAVANRRAVRLTVGSSIVEERALHLYGEISAGETPDRLLWVDNATGSEFTLPIDYGDIPRGSAEDTEVKLRNNSGSLTAASVQVTAEALYLNSGAWYTFKEAGGSFQATLPLSSSIGAGSDSPVLTIRRITPDDETLGLHAGRALASVGSWS